MKRLDYLSWDDYFMSIAILSAKRSKDPNTQVGACIVSKESKEIGPNRILGVGYNGFPINCSDDELPWSRDGKFLETKYPFVVHAELNAITNAGFRGLTGATIYVSLFPCNECAKAIIQSGIKEVVYLSDKYKDSDSVKASKKMFNLSGVKTRKMELSVDKIIISSDEI